jgi:hypothetical protein
LLVVGRSAARVVIAAVALATAWVGYLAVGSWEADEITTTAGTVLIVGASITAALVILSFVREAAATSLGAALVVSLVSWALALLID